MKNVNFKIKLSTGEIWRVASIDFSRNEVSAYNPESEVQSDFYLSDEELIIGKEEVKI